MINKNDKNNIHIHHDNQVQIKIIIDVSYEKSYFINIDNLKLIFLYETINLIRVFFTEGFPFYDSKDIDIPNFHDPNEDNYPGYKFYLDIKNSLIAILTSQIHNHDQKTLCLSSNIFFGYKKEKIINAKNELNSNFNQLKSNLLKEKSAEKRKYIQESIDNDKFAIYSYRVTLSDISPFICGKEILFSDSELPKRRLMNTFFLQYVNNYYLKRNNDSSSFFFV